MNDKTTKVYYLNNSRLSSKPAILEWRKNKLSLSVISDSEPPEEKTIFHTPISQIEKYKVYLDLMTLHINNKKYKILFAESNEWEKSGFNRTFTTRLVYNNQDLAWWIELFKQNSIKRVHRNYLMYVLMLLIVVLATVILFTLR